MAQVKESNSLFDMFTDDDLDTLAQWKNEESYKLLGLMVSKLKENVATEFLTRVGLSPSEWQSMKEIFISAGEYRFGKYILDIPNRATDKLKSRIKENEQNKQSNQEVYGGATSSEDFIGSLSEEEGNIPGEVD